VLPPKGLVQLFVFHQKLARAVAFYILHQLADRQMTILAHNLYRLFCKGFEGYSHCEAETIFDKFISAPGQIFIDDVSISVKLKKKRTLPILLEQMNAFKDLRYPWLDNFNIVFSADSTS